MPVLASRYTAPRGSYSGYVYYNRLKDMGDRYTELYTGAISNLNKQLAVLKNITTSKRKIDAAINRIRRMANNEFKKEKDFLQDIFGKSVDSNLLYGPNGAQELIEVINTTMRFKEIYELIKNNILNKSGEETRGISIKLGKIYKDIWNEKIQNEDFKEKVTEKVREALNISANGGNWERKIEEIATILIDDIENESFEELLGKIEIKDNENNPIQLKQYTEILNTFKAEFFQILGLDKEKIIEDLKGNIYNSLTKKGNLKQSFLKLTNKKIEGKSRSSHQGDLSEIWGNLLTTMGNMLNINNENITTKGYWGGKIQSTPDNMYTYNFTTDLTNIFEDGLSSLKRNDRPFNISVYNRIGEQLKKIEGAYIVYTSDKNYNLDYTHGDPFMGFSAGSEKSLRTITKIIDVAGQANTDMLTNIGINLLPGAIGEGNDEYIKKYITFNIAAFLFDDFTTIGEYDKNSGKALHLFDLNGIYIPLSVFLFKLADAISDAEKDINNIVVLDLSYPSIMYPEPGTGTKKWSEQREKALSEVKLSIHFLKGIRELLNGTL